MAGMGRGAWRLRALLVVMAGALLVHELRYRIAGVEAGHAEHAYLPWLQIAVVALVLAATVEFAIRLRRLVRGKRAEPGQPPRARVLWPALTIALALLVGAQEAAELRWLSEHHHHGDGLVSALLSDGGWLVLPLSLVVGGVSALLLRGAVALARALRRRCSARRHSPALPRLAAAAGWRPAGNVLARRLAGRGPPLLIAV